MSLVNAQKYLFWPDPEEILRPSGSGPKIFAKLAKEKLERNISRLSDGKGMRTGIISSNPSKDSTESPIAIICEFPRPVSEKTLIESHRLAWNFSRSPLLITIEPHCIRAWSCCERPERADTDISIQKTEIAKARFDFHTDKSFSAQAAAGSLHWIELVSGNFFRKFPTKFKRENCADHTLLENLSFVKQKLNEKQLENDICHDLLARVMFIQFLFDRKDSNGRSALNRERLERLYQSGILSEKYHHFSEILNNHKDSYALFRLLNEKFNGDLFPGKGETENDREAEWQNEIRQVKPEHLTILSDFVKGDLKLDSGQYSLWPLYSFDAIPLEFISSIYEEFVKKKPGVVYTPGYLADFILDGVLPWNSSEWDMKILDPACGSGIFLVKAFQRLIHRKKLANSGEKLKAEELRSILENNLFGVDIDPHAVRVASFSLYLAMCDEIDPIHYWDRVKFPRLRDKRIVCADFFQENIKGVQTEEDKGQYDLVIGNAPWGKDSITDFAKAWAKGDWYSDNNEKQIWDIKYGDIGPLFLVKSALLTPKITGQVSMLQPAGSLIFNQVDTAKNFRKKLFSNFNIEEIVNLSALAYGLFKDALSPACIVTLLNTNENSQPLHYICPKPVCTNEDEYRFTIMPQDINVVYPWEVESDPLIWSVLMWGNRRDYTFVKNLSAYTTIAQLTENGDVKKRQGIIRGNRKKKQDIILNRRIFTAKELPQEQFLTIIADDLPLNNDPYTDSKASTDFSAFELPQLILKQAWKKKTGRFQAAIVHFNCNKTGGILCSKSYVSIHSDDKNRSLLDAACLSYNSKLAVYYLLLTSGRFASYRAEVYVSDLLKVPIPEPRNDILDNISTYDDIDHRIRELFGCKEAEWVLVEDLFDYTLPDFKGSANSPGRRETIRYSEGTTEPDLTEYADFFMKVLKAGFGQEKKICTTVFHDAGKYQLPVRLIAVHLEWPGNENMRFEFLDSYTLSEKLKKINDNFCMRDGKGTGGIFYQRIARVYDTVETGNMKIPTLYLIKPDQKRYWTRSMAMHDADEVAKDIMLWQQKQKSVT